jgi:hypothetical protein
MDGDAANLPDVDGDSWAAHRGRIEQAAREAGGIPN